MKITLYTLELLNDQRWRTASRWRQAGFWARAAFEEGAASKGGGREVLTSCVRKLSSVTTHGSRESTVAPSLRRTLRGSSRFYLVMNVAERRICDDDQPD